MPIFTVNKSIPVPLDNKNLIVSDKIKSTLSRASMNGCGCYVFAVNGKESPKAEHHFLPIYVGKATKSFQQECFTSEKMNKLNRYLVHHGTKSLYLFLISHPIKKGPNNVKAISDMEVFLIREAKRANPDVLNNKNTKPVEWGIRGVIRGGIGKPSAAACQLKGLLKL